MTRINDSSTDSDFADAAFSSLKTVKVSAELSKKVAQIPAQNEKSGTLLFWPFPSAWQPSVALAAAALFGVLSGSLFESNSLNDSGVAEVLATQQTEIVDTSAPSSQATSSTRQATAEQAQEDSLEDLFALALGGTWQDAGWEDLETNGGSEELKEVTQ